MKVILILGCGGLSLFSDLDAAAAHFETLGNASEMAKEDMEKLGAALNDLRPVMQFITNEEARWNKQHFKNLSSFHSKRKANEKTKARFIFSKQTFGNRR